MSTTPTPPNGMVSNTELILRKILGEDVTPLPPNSRVEYYLMLVKDLIAQLQSAVNLRGETTTPLTDNATTNPIMIDGKSYTAVMNDAVIYQSGEFIFDGTKWHELGDLSNLTSLNIGAMTGYSKPSETSAIVVADTLNAAIGKLEKALDLKQSTIDSDHKLSADNVDDTNATNKFATAAQLDQINTNKNNISLINHAANTSIYFSETQPTGTITEGSYWISTSATKIYTPNANLFDESYTQGSINNSGQETSSTSRVRCYIDVSPNTDYTFKSSAYIRIMYGYNGNTPVTMILDRVDSAPLEYTFTTGSTITKIGIALMNSASTGTATDIIPSDVENGMLNLGDTALPYVPKGYIWQ